MILNIFILILSIEIIAGKTPSGPGPWDHAAGPGPWDHARGPGPWDHHCPPGKRLRCSRTPPDPRLNSYGPFFPIPPVKCQPGRTPPDPRLNSYGPFFPIPPVKCQPGRTPPDPRLNSYGPFFPIPPVKCQESAPPRYPDPAYGKRSRMTTTPWPNGHPKRQVNLILNPYLSINIVQTS